MSQDLVKTNSRLPLYVGELMARLFLAASILSVSTNIFTNDIRLFFYRALDISASNLPYVNFLWEYPPLTTLFLWLIPLTGKSLANFSVTFVMLMICCEYASLCLIRNAQPKSFMSITVYWSITVIPLSLIAWFRFDYVSVLFATIAMIAFERRKSLIVPVLLGFLAKLWPIYFAFGLFGQRRFKQAALVIGSCVLATFIWWGIAPDGFHAFIDYRQGEGYQIESTFGALLLLFGSNSVFSFGAENVGVGLPQWPQHILSAVALVGPAMIAVAALRTERRNDIALVGGIIAFVMCFSRLLSPQFIVWLAPFIAWVWPQHKKIGWLYFVTMLLTVADIFVYNKAFDYQVAFGTLLTLRNISLIGVMLALLYVAFRPAKQSDETMRA